MNELFRKIKYNLREIKITIQHFILIELFGDIKKIFSKEILERIKGFIKEFFTLNNLLILFTILTIVILYKGVYKVLALWFLAIFLRIYWHYKTGKPRGWYRKKLKEKGKNELAINSNSDNIIVPTNKELE